MFSVSHSSYGTLYLLLKRFQILMNAQRTGTSVTITVVTLRAPLSALVILDSHLPGMERPAMVLQI